MHHATRSTPTAKAPPERPNDPPPDRDIEETFVSSLGWALHLNGDREDRFALPISAALGIDPAAFHYSEMRDLFLAIRDTYLTDDAFAWPVVKKVLWDAGWFEGQIRWTLFLDVVTNQFMTIGALPALRTRIEAEAKPRQGGYE